MFKKLTAPSLRELACPECGTKPAQPPQRQEQVITCDRCGTRASAAEWAAHAREDRLAGRADQPPVTNIRREIMASGGTSWHIPAKGKFGFFMVFGIMWCLITGVVSGGFLAAFLSGGKINGDGRTWLLIPFFGVFWAIGLGLLYAGIREKWLRQRVTVDGGELRLRREMFGRHREKRLLTSDIRSVEQKEFYQKNYQPVFGIEIKAPQGKLRFGSTLTPEEKAWLVADLREVIFGPRPVANVPASLERQSGHFSVDIPNSHKNLWPLAILLMVIGGAFIFVGIRFLDERFPPNQGDDPALTGAIFRFFGMLSERFQSTWILIASVMAVGGSILAIRLFRERNTLERLEGNHLEIALRTYRHGRVWKEKSFPRRDITDIRASVSGNLNGRPMKRLELIIGNNAELLAGWIDGAAADALVDEVRSNL